MQTDIDFWKGPKKRRKNKLIEQWKKKYEAQT